MLACFGAEISGDRLERGDRLVEELFELLQSGDYPRERIRALENYTWSRPKGEPHQEVGGVMITLAAYCLAHDLDMHQAGEDELARIWTKVEVIRAKQAAKPVGSALPGAALQQLKVQDTAPLEHVNVTAEEHNAAFDPANDALGGAFKDGFREGWLFASDPGFDNREELEADYHHVVDIAPAECWDAYREKYFAMLPLAAIPEVSE
jgi:hypothetical protein